MEDIFDGINAPQNGTLGNILDASSDYFDGLAPSSEPEEMVNSGAGQERENQPTTDAETMAVGSPVVANKVDDQQRSIQQSEEEPRPVAPLSNVANLEVAPTLGTQSAPAPTLGAPAPTTTAAEDSSQLPSSIREAEDLGRLAMFGNQPKIKRRSQLRREQREQEGVAADQPPVELPSQPVARSRSARGRSPSVEAVGERNVSRATPSQPVSRRPAGRIAASSTARARSASVDKKEGGASVRGATPSQPATRRPMTRSGPVPVTRNRSNSATAVARAASPSIGNRPVTQPTPIARDGPVRVRGRSPSVEVVAVRRGVSPAVSQPRARPAPVATQPAKTGSPRGKHGPICVPTKTGATRTSTAAAARNTERSGAGSSSSTTGSATVNGPVTRSRSKELANSSGGVAGLATAMGGLELNANRSRDRTRRPVAVTVTQPVARKAPSARSNLADGSPIPTQRAFFNQLSHRQGSLGRDARPGAAGAASGLSRPTAASAARRSQQPAPPARTTAPRPARSSVPTAVRLTPTATRPAQTATRPAARPAPRAPIAVPAAGSQPRPRTNSTSTTAKKAGYHYGRWRFDTASSASRRGISGESTLAAAQTSGAAEWRRAQRTEHGRGCRNSRQRHAADSLHARYPFAFLIAQPPTVAKPSPRSRCTAQQTRQQGNPCARCGSLFLDCRSVDLRTSGATAGRTSRRPADGPPPHRRPRRRAAAGGAPPLSDHPRPLTPNWGELG